MRKNLVVKLGVIAVLAMAVAVVSAQATNPRFGKWKMKQDAPPPAINIMTYEPYGDGGMRITVESTNSKGEKSKWGYVTMFDGEFRPVTGQSGNNETAVEIIDERTTKITNKRDGEVRQVIINQLTEDLNTINNEYRRADGTVSHAVYERIKE